MNLKTASRDGDSGSEFFIFRSRRFEGNSWEAKQVWTARKDQLSPAKIEELRSILGSIISATSACCSTISKQRIEKSYPTMYRVPSGETSQLFVPSLTRNKTGVQHCSSFVMAPPNRLLA